jgi:AcrR family transcriptional regulator
MGRPRSQQAHDAILAAALDAATIDAIAARANAGKMTVYRRWPDKESLICAALDHVMHAVAAPDTGSLRSDLRVLMREQLAFYSDPATVELLSGLVAKMQRSPKVARVVRQGFLATRQAAMARVLTRWGYAKDVEMALDLFNGPLFYRFLFTGQPLDRRLAQGLIESLLVIMERRGSVRGRRTRGR